MIVPMLHKQPWKIRVNTLWVDTLWPYDIIRTKQTLGCHDANFFCCHWWELETVIMTGSIVASDRKVGIMTNIALSTVKYNKTVYIFHGTLQTASCHDTNFLSSLVAMQVVVMTTCSATSEDKVGIMMTLLSVDLQPIIPWTMNLVHVNAPVWPPYTCHGLLTLQVNVCHMSL